MPKGSQGQRDQPGAVVASAGVRSARVVARCHGLNGGVLRAHRRDLTNPGSQESARKLADWVSGAALGSQAMTATVQMMISRYRADQTARYIANGDTKPLDGYENG